MFLLWRLYLGFQTLLDYISLQFATSSSFVIFCLLSNSLFLISSLPVFLFPPVHSFYFFWVPFFLNELILNSNILSQSRWRCKIDFSWVYRDAEMCFFRHRLTVFSIFQQFSTGTFKSRRIPNYLFCWPETIK